MYLFSQIICFERVNALYLLLLPILEMLLLEFFYVNGLLLILSVMDQITLMHSTGVWERPSLPKGTLRLGFLKLNQAQI